MTKTKARNITVTQEQILAIDELMGIAERLVQSYEIYGGVDLKNALGHVNNVMGYWWDERQEEFEIEFQEPFYESWN